MSDAVVAAIDAPRFLPSVLLTELDWLDGRSESSVQKL
jgi:hypothetical protein